MASSASSSAEQHKSRGNAHFSAGEFEEAISAYSKAIISSPTTSTYYTNRGLCYIKLSKWEQALEDSEKAISLDSNSVKGHYFLGLSLLELQRYSSALTSLKLAFKLCQQQNLSYSDEIAKQVFRARKKKWEVEEAHRLSKKSELHEYLSRLILEEKERQKDKADLKEEEKQQINREHEEKLTELQKVFEQSDENYKKREIPDYLFGNINFELMKDPVIAPSGITYDRSSIMEHLQRVGHFDPVTRAKLTDKQLIPNLVMKEVIDDFLDKNGWAADF